MDKDNVSAGNFGDGSTQPDSTLSSGRFGGTEVFVVDEDFGVKIFKSQTSRFWQVQFNHPKQGQTRRSTKMTAKKAAIEVAKAITKKLWLGITEGLPTSRPEITITDAYTRYLSRLNDRGRSDTSIRLYERVYHQLTTWGEPQGITKLHQLTPQNLLAFEQALRTSGVALAKQSRSNRGRRAKANVAVTVRSKIQTVLALLNWAYKQKLLAEHPAPHYELPSGKSRERPTFSREEMALILADPDPLARDLWKIFQVTAARSGEVRHFTKEDVTQNPWGLHVRPKKCPATGKLWKPKHAKARLILIADPAAIEILQRRQATPGPYLFTDEQGRQWTAAQLLNRLKKRLRACGIAHGCLHAFRHTTASYLANNPAMTIVQVQQFLGHTDVKTTMTYVHVKHADVSRALASITFDSMVAQTTEPGDVKPEEAA